MIEINIQKNIEKITNKLTSKLFTVISLVNEVDIVENTDVNIIKISHNFKFFCSLFSDLVINKRGTKIQIIIHISSFKLKASQKYNKLTIITNIGEKVLYRGKKSVVSILSRLFILVIVEKK